MWYEETTFTRAQPDPVGGAISSSPQEAGADPSAVRRVLGDAAVGTYSSRIGESKFEARRTRAVGAPFAWDPESISRPQLVLSRGSQSLFTLSKRVLSRPQRTGAGVRSSATQSCSGFEFSQARSGAEVLRPSCRECARWRLFLARIIGLFL